MSGKAHINEQDLERIKKLRIFDDEFLREVFDGEHSSDAVAAAELVLNILFDRDDIKIIKMAGQREIKGIEGHSVKLDIMAEDCDNKLYDIEIQREDKGALPLRARYNSSLMDTILLPEGTDYSKLISTYVIFFTEKDAVGDGLPIHHYEMRDNETGNLLGDERHIIFVNGDNKDTNTRLGKLIHDIKCTSANDMYYPELAKRVRHFKETEGGIDNMSKMLEDMRNEAARKAARKASILTAIEIWREVGFTELE
ncbi:MAG: PD-(D/E)XK nuclease family transposase, partial [Eubacterium sp.]|nr:PD-(D/E)XK nuclease family transposase [Eubacterium sp.]